MHGFDRASAYHDRFDRLDVSLRGLKEAVGWYELGQKGFYRTLKGVTRCTAKW